MDSMISRAMESYANEHTVRGRPTLKDLKRFRRFRRDREPSRISARTQERLSNKSKKVKEFVYECICSSTPK